MKILLYTSSILDRAAKYLISIVEAPSVRTVEYFRSTFNLKTYQVENGFVFLVLAISLIVTDNALNGWKWIEFAAVYLTFLHASVSQRLEERQHKRFQEEGIAEVECYYKLQYYIIGKEILWMVTFIHLGAWAALVGVFIFLLYYPWRAVWRKHHPIK